MHRHSFDLFSDYFTLRENVLSRLDPRIKVLSALTLLLGVVLSGHVGPPLTVAGGAIMTMYVLGVRVRVIAIRFVPALAIAAVICIIRPFFVAGEAWWRFPLMGSELVATREGAWEGLLIATRVLGAVSTMLLLSMTTPAHRVFAVLRWAYCPRTLVEVAMLMYRYIFALLGHAADAMAAARIRLGFSSCRRALNSMGMVAGAVLTRSMDQAQRTHEAMQCRAYRGKLPAGHLDPMSRGQIAVLIVAPACITGFFVLSHLLVT
ncbi:MAG: cobalt ECF transporter T component CbiQ [Planctomycetota bacterium]